MSATLRPTMLRPGRSRLINLTHWRLMRQGFDAETIQRMEFVKYLYATGRYVS